MLNCDCDLRCRNVLLVDVVLEPFARKEPPDFDFKGFAIVNSSSEDEAASAESESKVALWPKLFIKFGPFENFLRLSNEICGHKIRIQQLHSIPILREKAGCG